jgi:hypothetical protein
MFYSLWVLLHRISRKVSHYDKCQVTSSRGYKPSLWDYKWTRAYFKESMSAPLRELHEAGWVGGGGGEKAKSSHRLEHDSLALAHRFNIDAIS